MIAHGGPYQYYYNGRWDDTAECNDMPHMTHRVKPGPKRDTVTKDMWMDASTGRMSTFEMAVDCVNCTVTYDTIDGVIDMATYRVVAK